MKELAFIQPLWKCQQLFQPLATKPKKLSCWDNIFKGDVTIRDNSLLSLREGDLVLINLHSLSLLKNETGHGRNLLMKYNQPFDIVQKLRAVSY